MTPAPASSTVHSMEVFVEFGFEAAHHLTGVPSEHMCARLHGHSYFVRVTAAGIVEPATGWVVDFAVLQGAIQPIRARLDHRCLNDIPELSNPTAEHLAMWLWRQLEGQVPGLRAVEVREMPGCGCIYRGAS